jgi:endonuclease YncB( thermonuclease family)
MNRLFLAFLLTLSCAAQAQTISGLVVSISDGDTLTVLDASKKQHKVRLSGIDAPEKTQAFGNASRQHLADLCFQQQATVTVKSKDRYGRAVADVECKGQDAGQHQVGDGMAWVYTQYAKGYTRLPPLQAGAKAGKRGLWSDGVEPVEPWLYRRKPKQQQVSAVTNTASSETCFTGPRGGTYTITASGRKNYSGC